MDNKAIRRTHLLRAIQRFDDNIAELARVSGCSESYMSQIKNGTREMGDRFARKIEKGLNLPKGAWDTPLPGLDDSLRAEVYQPLESLSEDDLRPWVGALRQAVAAKSR